MKKPKNPIRSRVATPKNGNLTIPPCAKPIRFLRESRKITLRALASETGIHYTTLGLYEQGTREPALSNLLTLARYYGVSLDYLAGRCSYTFNPEELFWKSVHEELGGIKQEDKERVRSMITTTIRIL